jgi:hypothetical protein
MRKNIYEATAWKSRSTKLAVLIPCRDTVYSLFTSCLVEMVKTCTMAGIDTHVIYDAGSILLNQRENLANQALEINSDYMLWLDSDMMFPSTTAMRMMAHNKTVVAANYMKRSIPLNSVAYEKRGDWDNWLPLMSDEELISVEGVGMGCMMIKTEILKEIEKPWFAFEYKDDSWHGEDFYFQTKLREVGHEIFIDMNLGRQIRHIGQWAFGPNLGTNEEQIVKRRKKTIKEVGEI